MKDRSDRRYCTLDHANKRRELARQTPYQFWLRQVSRGDAAESPPDERASQRRHARRGR